MTNTTQPEALRAKAIDEIMEQAQVFASAWSLIGSQFDIGHMLDDAYDAQAELRAMVSAALQAAPPMQEPAPLTDERIREIDDETHFHESRGWSLRFARAIQAAQGIR